MIRGGSELKRHRLLILSPIDPPPVSVDLPRAVVVHAWSRSGVEPPAGCFPCQFGRVRTAVRRARVRAYVRDRSGRHHRRRSSPTHLFFRTWACACACVYVAVVCRRRVAYAWPSRTYALVSGTLAPAAPFGLPRSTNTCISIYMPPNKRTAVLVLLLLQHLCTQTKSRILDRPVRTTGN